MNSAAEVLAVAAGALIVLGTLLSAVRTVVMPHGAMSTLTRTVFGITRRAFQLQRRLPMSAGRRHRVMSLYAPVTLVCLPLVWLSSALVGFTTILWGLGTQPWRAALKLAGSSMLTLGFADVNDLPRLIVSFAAAALAISVLALLLVTYLPTMYQAYSSRAIAIAGLETFAGVPPEPVELLVRHHEIGAEQQLGERWQFWRNWFFEARDTHTALPAVVFFRSGSPEREWPRAVGALLDAAALWNAVCQSADDDPDASLCIRAGAVALNDIAKTFRLDYVDDPSPTDPISVPRSEFDAMFDRLATQGMNASEDRDAAWQAWAGWRVNYDVALNALIRLTTTSTEI